MYATGHISAAEKQERNKTQAGIRRAGKLESVQGHLSEGGAMREIEGKLQGERYRKTLDLKFSIFCNTTPCNLLKVN
jgi:hypothetical protein